MELLIVLVLALHLMCVNVAAAGPLVCVWLEWREARGDAAAGSSGRYLATVSVVLLLVGGVLGVVLGALLWDESYRAAVRLLPSRIGFGVWELLFSLVLMIVHAIWWRLAGPTRGALRAVRAVLPLLAATNSLYHFPFLFVVLSNVAAIDALPAEPIDSQFVQLMLQGSVMSRSIHFILASFAMTGVMLIGFALKLQKRGATESEVRAVARRGGLLALIPTLAQLPVGLWVMTQLPRPAMRLFMGDDLLATGLFLISVIAALWLMHRFAAVAMGKVDRGSLIQAMAAMTVVVVLMTAVLRYAADQPALEISAAGRRAEGTAWSLASGGFLEDARRGDAPGVH